MKKNITTLEELEAEQKRLKMTLEVTRHEFARSLGTNRHMLKDFMLKKVAIPAGAVGLGAVAVKNIFSTGSKEEKDASSANLIGQMFPLALSFVQAYFLKEQKQQMESLENTQNTNT